MSSAPHPERAVTGGAHPFGRIAVLGLGAMGGSFARALRDASPDAEVRGWSPVADERAEALETGALTAAPAGWRETVRGTELVVLALPLGAVRSRLDAVARAAPDALLSDLASLKAPVAEAARDAGVDARWVGAHPMAGSERSGFAASRAALFRGARVWLTVAAEEARTHVPAAVALWEALGARPREIDAEEHDRRMTLVSHLPQLVANLLANRLSRSSVAAAELGPGGRDMTRLAGSDPEMWLDLFEHASPELPGALRALAAEAAALAERLEEGDVERLRALMGSTRLWKERSGCDG